MTSDCKIELDKRVDEHIYTLDFTEPSLPEYRLRERIAACTPTLSRRVTSETLHIDLHSPPGSA